MNSTTCRQVEALFAAKTERAAHQQQQRRAQPLSAGGDDVARDFANQGHCRIEASADHGIDFPHVVRDEG
jgi:hypothetical protein